jgi:hypothetical protein
MWSKLFDFFRHRWPVTDRYMHCTSTGRPGSDLSSASESGSKSTDQQDFDKFDTFEDDHLYPWCRFILHVSLNGDLLQAAQEISV